jgi:hypothetical protein
MAASTGYAVDDLTALRAIDNTIKTSRYIVLVASEKAWYIFVPASMESESIPNIIYPDDGIGRWYKTKAVVTSTDILDFSEAVDDRVGALLVDTGLIDVTYNDASNQITFTLVNDSITNAQISPSAAITQSKIANLITDLAGKASVNHTHVAADVVNFSEAVDDRVALLLQQGTGITLTYDDTANTLTISSSGGGSSLTIKDEGTSQGTATSINFTGSAVTASVSGSDATINISAPSSLTTNSAAITTSSIASNTSETQSFNCGNDIGFFTKVETDYPARIRVYISSAYASADASRPVTVELSGEHGCILECVTTGSNLILDLSPVVAFYTLTSSTLWIIITNNDSVSRSITCTLTGVKW